ncbi:MFS transporter [Natronomonas sp. EA1]|uniref:MFS transporter n=1 Tax=Natronomonas sp. EA1 TaxID=3421655 RepID=UPI003EB9C4DA
MAEDGRIGDTAWLLPRYYLVRVANTSGFFLPVAILILQDKGFGLAFIGLAYAVYAVAKLVVEVPTGYLGDLLGRRASLALGSVIRALVIGGYPFIPNEALYLWVHVLWAVGRAFRSGTQNAWLYEILQARFDESEFARIESRGNTLKLVTDAGTALAGGALYTIDPALPFVATAAIALTGVPLLATFPSIDRLRDSEAVDPVERDPLSVRDAIELLRLQAARPALRWFVAYAAVFYSLFVVTRIYEQPALDAVGVPVAGFGVLYAGFKLVSAGGAASVGRLHAALGTRGVLVAMAPVYGLAYASILLTPLAVLPVLFLNRAVRTVTSPVIDQYLNDRLDDIGRATVLSGVSMALALVGAAARVVAGEASELLGAVGFLPWAGVLLSLVGVGLWALTNPVRASGVTSPYRPDGSPGD